MSLQQPIKIAFTGFWHGESEAEIRAHNPVYQLLANHFDLALSRDPDVVIYSSFGNEYLRYRCSRVFYTGENERPDFRDCDWAFTFDHDPHPRHYRLPLYRLYPHFDQLLDRQPAGAEAADRAFCNFVYSNAKASKRIEFFRRLSTYRPVDSGGRILNNIGGPVADKLAFLARYKFTIAFENSSHPGYTTEKLLDPLVAGSVPIYWGNPAVGRDFDPACFINAHDFADLDALVEHVAQVDRDPERYLAYLNAPVFPGGRVPDALSEQAIVKRFERIFTNGQGPTVARPADPIRYWLSPGTWVKRLRRGIRNRRGFK